VPQARHTTHRKGVCAVAGNRDLLSSSRPNIQNILGVSPQPLPLRRQLHVVAGAREQLDAKELFQLADAGAYRGLGEEQVLGGLAEVSGSIDLKEGLQEFYIHRNAARPSVLRAVSHDRGKAPPTSTRGAGIVDKNFR
jgi:hypothetical protein